RRYGLFVGESFINMRFGEWLQEQGIPWPYYPSGQPMLHARLFRDMAAAYPQLGPLHQLRQSLGKMRLTRLAIGADGFNRCALRPFRSVSGRNQPSNSAFIFGPASWFRSLIKPPPGYAIAYCDWGAQEIAIGAALSGDEGMIAGYRNGDPHVDFAC